VTELKEGLVKTLYEMSYYDPLIYYYLNWYECNKDEDGRPDFEELLVGLCIAQSSHNKELNDQIENFLMTESYDNYK